MPKINDDFGYTNRFQQRTLKRVFQFTFKRAQAMILVVDTSVWSVNKTKVKNSECKELSRAIFRKRRNLVARFTSETAYTPLRIFPPQNIVHPFIIRVTLARNNFCSFCS